MNYIKHLVIGMIFGLILTKSEVISWYRIVEMFRFESFHMYGFIFSAIAVAAISILIIKKLNLKNSSGETVKLIPIPLKKNNLLGGIVFGLGWGLIGACPGPMFALLGGGYLIILVAIIGGLAGTFVYGLLHDKLQ